MSLAYRIFYAVGFAPWEESAKPPITDQVAALVAREEHGRHPPFGRVLDLGCGSGIYSVMLARRGWDVTGIDFVAKALRTATTEPGMPESRPAPSSATSPDSTKQTSATSSRS